MQHAEKTKVVVAGGGTSGWLTAYSLAKRLGKLLDITLVESDEIGIIGVGEAAIPSMRATQATFKLGSGARKIA